MAQFELALLGSPSFRAQGERVRFATRKAQALLIYLAVEAVPVTREKLVDLLWVDSDAARGRVSLRTTLSQVRGRLQSRNGSHPDAADHSAAGTTDFPRPQSLLVAETDTISINPQADYQLDIRTLDAAYTAARNYKPSTASVAGLRELRTHLERGAAVYVGDFLDGFSPGDAPNFDDWTSVQREKWHMRLSVVLNRLSQLQFEGGEFSVGIETASRWVQHDALNEIAHRRLMQLHLAAGNRASAVQAYEACRAILARELNAKPSPETEALAERLHTQVAMVDAMVPRAEPSRAPANEASTAQSAAHEPARPEVARPQVARSQVASTALIGRAVEHLQLVQTYRAAREGAPQAMLIQGEPGIGKTRLAQEFLGWAIAQGALMVQAAAYELTVNLPYQIWIDAFRNLIGQPYGRAAFDSLEPAWRDALSHILPELVSTHAANVAPAIIPAHATEGDALHGRSQLFEAAFRFIQRLATGSTRATTGSAKPPLDQTKHRAITPRVIYLDDVQWGDAASLDLLQYLTHRCAEEGLPVLLVMTLREEALDAFEPTLVALRRHVPVKVMPLRALSQADSNQLVHTLIAQFIKAHDANNANDVNFVGAASNLAASDQLEPNYAQQTARLARTLFGETAGHPLYLLETFKSLLETMTKSAAELAQVSVAPQTMEAELARWQHALDGWLAPGVKEVIQARLSRVSPRAMTLIQAVAVLGQRHDFEACYQTANLNEDDALALLDEITRRGLLRESANGVISFTHDKIREVVYTGLSASRRRSLHRRSAETLERLYQNRLDDYATLIAQHFDALNDTRAGAYFQRAGDAAAQVYAYREAATHFAHAIQLAVTEEHALPPGARREDVRATIQTLHYRQASMHVQMAEFGNAIQVVRELGQLAHQWNDAVLERTTRAWIAPNLALQGPHMQLEAAEEMAEQILAEARAAHLLIEEVQGLRTLMRVALLRAQFGRALQYGQTILGMVDTWPDEILHGYVLNNVALAALNLHHFDLFHQYQTESLRIWRAINRPSAIITSLTHLSHRALCGGEFENAIALAEEAQRISRDSGSNLGSLQRQARVGLAYFELGHAERAIDLLRETIQLSQMGQHDITEVTAGVDLARIHGYLGQIDEGLVVADAAYQTARAKISEWELHVTPVLAYLHGARGAWAQARHWLARGRDLMTNLNCAPEIQMGLDEAEAELLLNQTDKKPDAERALVLSTAAVAMCRQQGWRQPLPMMLLLQSRALRALGRLAEAAHSLQVAADEATAMHAGWSLQQIQVAQRHV